MDVSIVLPKNDLSKDIKLSEIKNKICDRLNSIENLQDYKLNNEFLVLATNLIEFYVKKKYGINKMDLAISIYERIFQEFSEQDKEIVKKNIQFIWNNGHIKKTPYYILFCVGIKEWLKKKFA